MTVDELLAGWPGSRSIFDRLCEVIEAVGPVQMRATKSQIAFSRRRAFAWAWIPARYLRGECAPLVLTLAFRYRHPSPRWKEIVEPRTGRFTHHLELYAVADFDDEVRAWINEAWLAAV
jgi:Fe-S-cluster formation regulator IscX/YfhJ